MSAVERLRPLRRLCHPALLVGLLALASSGVGWAAPTSAHSCEPFCGVLRFMPPTPLTRVQHADHPVRHRAYAARRNGVREARFVPPPRIHPRSAYAAAGRPPPYYVLVYPGYGYGYYYVYPYVYRVY